MMERLFAVSEQREVFLLWLACGFVWGVLTHGAELIRKRAPHWGLLADAAAVLALLLMILTVLVHTHEGVRLYGLLGVAVGSLLYRSGLACLLQGAGMLMKKALGRAVGGRKNE